jgi:hypothetical protein
MFNLRQLIILTTAALALAQEFDWDCTDALAPCNNACFAVNCKDSPYTLNHDGNYLSRRSRRIASGCNRSLDPSSSRACSNTHYRSFGHSCNEYPFASTIQGGAGAILRCVVDSLETSSKLYNIVLNNQFAKISFKVQGEEWPLGNFYKRVPKNHEFSVVVRNYSGGA